MDQDTVKKELTELREIGIRMKNHERFHYMNPPQNTGDEILKKADAIAKAVGIEIPEPVSA